jgi:ribosomal protein S18 acetylase RimI-like enzyme
MNIELFDANSAMRNADELIELLRDAVDSGASVGFLPPLSREDASTYWRGIFQEIGTGKRLVLGALEGDRLVGSAQLEFASKANALHRAEVQRVLVHTSVRRQGIAEQLMRRVEELACERGRSLLVLDTREGDASELLYRKLGYTVAGVIPGYALSASGALDGSVFYYKRLDCPRTSDTAPRSLL